MCDKNNEQNNNGSVNSNKSKNGSVNNNVSEAPHPCNSVNVSESENVKDAESQLKQTAPQRVDIDKQSIDKSENNNSKESRLQQTVPQNNNIASESRLKQTVPQTSKQQNNKQSSNGDRDESQLKQTVPQPLNSVSQTTSPPNESSSAENENMEVILSDAQRVNTDEPTDCVMSDPSSSMKRKRDLSFVIPESPRPQRARSRSTSKKPKDRSAPSPSPDRRSLLDATPPSRFRHADVKSQEKLPKSQEKLSASRGPKGPTGAAKPFFSVFLPLEYFPPRIPYHCSYLHQFYNFKC